MMGNSCTQKLFFAERNVTSRWNICQVILELWPEQSFEKSQWSLINKSRPKRTLQKRHFCEKHHIYDIIQKHHLFVLHCFQSGGTIMQNRADLGPANQEVQTRFLLPLMGPCWCAPWNESQLPFPVIHTHISFSPLLSSCVCYREWWRAGNARITLAEGSSLAYSLC